MDLSALIFPVNVAISKDGNDTVVTVTKLVSGAAVGSPVITVRGPTAPKIIGTKQDDVLTGGDAAEELTGDLGNDTLTGGLGNDTYVFLPAGGGVEFFSEQGLLAFLTQLHGLVGHDQPFLTRDGFLGGLQIRI